MIIPERPATPRYNPGDGCELCQQPAATVDGINGRRCTDHAPVFDVDKCVELAAAGFPGAALAYLRGTT